MKRVAVVTTFVDLFEAFSLCRVVEGQLKSLLRSGYFTTFVACDGFRPRGVFANPLLRQARLPLHMVSSDEEPVERPAEFRAAVEQAKARLWPVVREVDVVVTHDIVYLQGYLAYNVACRELAAEFPGVRWLHFVHSGPLLNRQFSNGDPRGARFTPFPGGCIVYPNAYDVSRVAQQFGVREQEVRIVPHALDYDAVFGFHPLTKALVERHDLYEPAILAVYPARMDRGKQPEKLVRLFSELKRAGASIRLIIACIYATGQQCIDYRNDIQAEADRLGLAESEVVFTNDLSSLTGIPDDDLRRYEVELPHKVILDLFQLSNIYVHPSASETYSLVCQEAAATGNLLVLNDDFPPMREIYGPCATYVKFSSSLFTTTYNPDELAYYAGIARKILHAVEYEKTVQQKTRLRQTRNLGAVFAKHLEPLLHA
jgi:glycosyltransferase involved in cell wall biosynthesis